MVTSSTKYSSHGLDEEPKKGEGAGEEGQNPLENTLLDIHKLISDIENPFTLVGKLVNSLGKEKTLELLDGREGGGEETLQRPNAPHSGLAPLPPTIIPALQESPQIKTTQSSELTTPKPVAKSELAERNDENQTQQVSSNQPINIAPNNMTLNAPAASRLITEYKETILQNVQPSSDRQVDRHNQQPNMDIIRNVNSIALANFLANVFGKEGSIEVLGSYVKRNWVKEEVARTLLDATTLLGKNDLNAIHRGVKEASAEDHRIALYLLEEFAESLFSYNLSVRFQDLLFLLQAVLGLNSKGTVNPNFPDQGDFR